MEQPLLAPALARAQEGAADEDCPDAVACVPIVGGGGGACVGGWGVGGDGRWIADAARKIGPIGFTSTSSTDEPPQNVLRESCKRWRS